MGTKGGDDGASVKEQPIVIGYNLKITGEKTQEFWKEWHRLTRIAQLTANRTTHQRAIQEIDEELAHLAEPDIARMTY